MSQEKIVDTDTRKNNDEEEKHVIEAEGCGSSITPPPEFHYNHSKSVFELAKLISVLHLPFNFAQEGSNFIEYQQTCVNPDAKPVSKSTLEKEVKKLFRNGVKELAELFRDLNNNVSLSIDIWTDISQTKFYMSIHCVWIDINGNIQRRLVAFQLLQNFPVSAQDFCRKVMLILKKYRLTRKIFSISFDKDYTNFTSFVEIERLCGFLSQREFVHIRHICYVINLCVQVGLKVLEMHLHPIKNAVKCLWDSQVFKQWVKFCKSSKSRPKDFPFDIPYRWDTTYEMLNESFAYKDQLCLFFASTITRVDLYPHQWNGIDKILQILQVFYDANYNLSCVYKPTIHLVIQECVNIASIFSQFSCDDMLSECVKAMKTKWCEFFMNVPEIYLIAAVFDPRVRLDGLKEYLNAYYQSLCDSSSSVNVSDILINVRNNLNSLYIKYNPRKHSHSHSHSTSGEDGKSSRVCSTSRAAAILMEHHRKIGSWSSMAELDTYLTITFKFDEKDYTDFDILQWWRQHEEGFPVLSAISKDILACPISTVPKEEIFSVERKRLSEIRCCMYLDSLEAHSCLGDWVNAENRDQEISRFDNSELFEVYGYTSDEESDEDDGDDDDDSD